MGRVGNGADLARLMEDSNNFKAMESETAVSSFGK
jgi:hypothetical protein